MDEGEQIAVLRSALEVLPQGRVRQALDALIRQLESPSSVTRDDARSSATQPQSSRSQAAHTSVMESEFANAIARARTDGMLAVKLAACPTERKSAFALAVFIVVSIHRAAGGSINSMLSASTSTGARPAGFAAPIRTVSVEDVVPSDFTTDSAHFNAAFNCTQTGSKSAVKVNITCMVVGQALKVYITNMASDTRRELSFELSELASVDATGTTIQQQLLNLLQPLLTNERNGRELVNRITTAVDEVVGRTRIPEDTATSPPAAPPSRSQPGIGEPLPMRNPGYTRPHSDLLPNFGLAEPGALFHGGGGGFGGSGGMLIGPDNPLFHDPGRGMVPPGVPPGARYDPIFPYSVGPPGPRPFPPRGLPPRGAPHPAGPQPDHLRPPPDSDFPPDIYW